VKRSTVIILGQRRLTRTAFFPASLAPLSVSRYRESRNWARMHLRKFWIRERLNLWNGNWQEGHGQHVQH
jgi:hypothetical protein